MCGIEMEQMGCDGDWDWRALSHSNLLALAGLLHLVPQYGHAPTRSYPNASLSPNCCSPAGIMVPAVLCVSPQQAVRAGSPSLGSWC